MDCFAASEVTAKWIGFFPLAMTLVRRLSWRYYGQLN
jgi:hypothetical protein